MELRGPDGIDLHQAEARAPERVEVHQEVARKLGLRAEVVPIAAQAHARSLREEGGDGAGRGGGDGDADAREDTLEQLEALVDVPSAE